jgi:hypothetical protein
LQKGDKMFKKMLFVAVAASVVMLAVGIAPLPASMAYTAPPPPAGVTIPYPGRLNDDAAQPVADGAYDFTFALYDAETGGTLLWSEKQSGVPVKSGEFLASLGSVSALPKETMGDGGHWLEVAVRGPGEAEFTALAPRQELSLASSVVPASTTAGPSCAHDHFGETWSGDGLIGLFVDMPNGNLTGSLWGKSGGLGYGVVGQQQSVNAIGAGVFGDSSSTNGFGGHFTASGGGIGIYAQNNGATANKATIRADNTLTTTGMAAYLTNSSDYATANLTNNGTGEVLYLQSHGGSYLRGVNSVGTNVFRLAADGHGHASGGWDTGGADFAEMLPAVPELEATDVLVIGPDGKLAKATEPYQTTIAGVYSTKPGFVGGMPVEGESDGEIPLAVVGVVPVKVSAENGAIQPGDLLVTSSTAGHAMRGVNPPVGTVLGKALESLDSGVGTILALVTLQ